MALKLNLNKLKQNQTNNETIKTEEQPVSSLNLNLNKTKVAEEPVQQETAFNLSFTPNNTYDLDEMIQKKLRSNSDSALMLQVFERESVKDNIVAMITRDIIEAHGLTWNEETYKTDISVIPGFERLFDIYLKTYYEIYLANIGQVSSGSMSMDTVLNKISIFNQDYRKYLLESGSYPTQIDQYFKDYNKPNVIWTEGTLETDSESDPSWIDQYIKDFMTYCEVYVKNSTIYLNDYTEIELRESHDDYDLYSMKDYSFSTIGGNSEHAHTLVTGFNGPEEEQTEIEDSTSEINY